ncbi:MAG TPA: Fe-S cluster assembly protein SufD [Gemmatimonadales bacterium]|nr:Fe-S cluster assembly protein SufD [Gemmatimonadales bacterium]
MNDSYVEAFERFTRNGGGQGPAGVLTLRREAFERFRSAGFPTAKDEEWRFTPVTPITRAIWRFDGQSDGRTVSASELLPYRFGAADWCTLVFVDGHFNPELSYRPALPTGVTVETLSEALERDPALVERTYARVATPDLTPFAALNTAFAREGAIIRIAAGVEVPAPIHLLYVATTAATGLAVQLRTVLLVERSARAQLVESYAGLGSSASFHNVVTEVVVGESAWVEHTRIQRESEAAFHIGLTQIEQARDSHYRSFTLAAGGAIARHDLRARLSGENVETLLYGLYLGRGEQLVDNHTVIFHDRPNCRSWEVYKGILDGKSHAVFNGKVFVQPEAQKTDAKQTNRNLLLSDGAKVDTKPQLEIFADDVKCTHGATVGRIDESAFFYLQSRGIPRAQAQQVLTYAFAAEVVNEVASAPVREALDALVAARLGIEP